MDTILSIMPTDKERIASLEVRTAMAEEDLKVQSAQIKSIDDAVRAMVHEVRGIRNALYILATAIVSQIPALKDAYQYIKLILGNVL